MKIRWKMELESELEEKVEASQRTSPSPKNSERLKVLVAVDGEATQDVMKEVLTGAGYDVYIASTGKEALSLLEKEHPGIAYLDVALPQVLGFEVCEIIKKSQRLKATKVILVSAIYDKTRYKRAPSSLYGADDYIERHHIQDGLLTKLNKLLRTDETSPVSYRILPGDSSVEVMDKESLSPRHGVRETDNTLPPEIQTEIPPAPEVFESAASESLLEQPSTCEVAPETELSTVAALPESGNPFENPDIGSALEVAEVSAAPPETTPVLTPEENVKHEEAKRFARLIISDIALYNQKTIEEGIENGNVEELLKDDMVEAEKLYRERVSKEVREKTKYLQEALRDLVDRKIKMLKKGN
ncbi:MAG: response regulator [Nitrospirae bacterium]|nr:response regulator [Nitrospirota bacterium]